MQSDDEEYNSPLEDAVPAFSFSGKAGAVRKRKKKEKKEEEKEESSEEDKKKKKKKPKLAEKGVVGVSEEASGREPLKKKGINQRVNRGRGNGARVRGGGTLRGKENVPPKRSGALPSGDDDDDDAEMADFIDDNDSDYSPNQ